MDFRTASISDIPLLAELRKQQLIDEGMSPNENIDHELTAFFEKKMRDGSFIEWVAVDNNTIIATAAIIFYEFPPSYANPSGIKGYVANMYTASQYRRQGIATTLLDKLIAEAKKRKVTKIYLIASKMGRPVYLKYGFQETDEWLEISQVLSSDQMQLEQHP